MRLMGSILAVLLLPALASAQRASRFVPIEIDGDPERILLERLLRMQTLDINRDLLKKLLDPKQLERFKQLNLDDPKLKERLDKLPEDFKAKLKEDLEKLVEQTKKQPGPAQGEVPQPAKPVAPPTPKPKSQPKEDLEEKFLRWLKSRMEDMDGSRLGDFIRESPAWSEALSDLRLAALDRDGHFPNLGEWAERWLPDASRAFEGLGGLPDLPDVSLPSLDLRLPAIRGSLPRIGGPSLPSVGFFNGLQWALWILLAVAVLIGVVYLLRHRRTAAVRQRDGWRPGPWPVDPARIATAEQLIRAFDYLALLRLGPDAQGCNHRTVAERLGPEAEPTTTRQAAHQLAGLYEQARYAPDAVLSADALAVARQHLCLLAGRAAS